MSNRGRPGNSRYVRKFRSVIKPEAIEKMLERCSTLQEKSLIAILYYTGLRIAEICGDKPKRWKVLSQHGKEARKTTGGKSQKDWMQHEDLYEWKLGDSLPGIIKEDIILEDNFFHIYSEPIKHGKREEDYSLEIDTNWHFVYLIFNQWEATLPKHKVWDMDTHKAWILVSKVSDGLLYPHAFRLSKVTQFARDSRTAMIDLKNWFGWRRIQTAEDYIVSLRPPQSFRDIVNEQEKKG